MQDQGSALIERFAAWARERKRSSSELHRARLLLNAELEKLAKQQDEEDWSPAALREHAYGLEQRARDEDWTVLKHTQGSPQEDGQTWERWQQSIGEPGKPPERAGWLWDGSVFSKRFLGPDQGGWFWHPPYRGHTWRDFTASMPNTYGWLFRLRQLADCTWQDAYVHDFDGPKEGHCFYTNPHGNLRIQRVVAENLNGHFCHFDNRETLVNSDNSAPDNRPVEGGTITLTEFVTANTDRDPQRGASAIQLANLGRVDPDGKDRRFAVEISRGEMTCYFDKPGQKGERSRGAVLVEGDMPYHQYTRTRIRDLRVEMHKCDRSLLYVNASAEIEVTGCLFQDHGGVARVTIDRRDYSRFAKTPRAKRILWYANEGNSSLYVNGSYLGPVDRDYLIEA